MKRVLLMSVAMLVFAGSPQARPIGWNDCDEPCRIDVQQLSPGHDDDDEVWRLGPRGEDGEAIELAPGGRDWGDDEVVEPLPQAPPSDGDTDE